MTMRINNNNKNNTNNNTTNSNNTNNNNNSNSSGDSTIGEPKSLGVWQLCKRPRQHARIVQQSCLSACPDLCGPGA